VVSRSVIDRLIRGRFLRVVDEPIVADSLLSGQVTAYTSTPIAYGRDDEISRYISQMSVSAWLRRSTTNEVIWQGAISWSEEYSASQNRMVQEDNEAAAIHTIGERIAEELYSRLGDNF
jgi:Tfp pilus assembly protein PilN